MAFYRFYRIRGDGYVDGPPILEELPHDGAALTRARALQNSHDIEVWDGKRLVGYCVFQGGDHGATTIG